MLLSVRREKVMHCHTGYWKQMLSRLREPEGRRAVMDAGLWVAHMGWCLLACGALRLRLVTADLQSSLCLLLREGTHHPLASQLCFAFRKTIPGNSFHEATPSPALAAQLLLWLPMLTHAQPAGCAAPSACSSSPAPQPCQCDPPGSDRELKCPKPTSSSSQKQRLGKLYACSSPR